jgi:N6-adenosine-specific RNA methylase IME4
VAVVIPRPRCIAADPPWPETGGCNRGADAHYDVQHVEDIPGIIQRCPLWPPESDAHLWLWATVTHLPAALWLMERVGFRYVTHWVWRKVRDERLQIGLGQYQRTSHELLLLGTRGDAMVPPPEFRAPSVFDAPRTRHSAKPDVAYELIEQVSPGPRAELFGREPRPGWWVWGNELGIQEDVAAPGDCDLELWAATRQPVDDRQARLL